MADKQYLAKILYAREHLDGKVVAKKVGVSEKTMSEWVNKFGWRNLRKRLLITKEEQINNLYEQLEELNNKIRSKPEGQRYADTKEADVQIKTTSAIRNLETDLNLADKIEAGMQFIKYAQKVSALEVTIQITDLWHDFIQSAVR